MLSIQTGTFMVLANQLHSLSKQHDQLASLLRQFSVLQLPRQQANLRALRQKQNELQTSIKKTVQYLQNGQTLYEGVETSLQTYASNLAKGKQNAGKLPYVSIAADQKPSFGYVKTDFNKATKRFHTSFNKNKNIMSYLKNGVCVGLFGGYELACARAGFDKRYAQGEVGVKAGKAHVSADAKVLLFQDKKFKPSLEVTAEAEAALAQGNASLRVGNDYLNAQGEVNVGLGVVKAGAKAVINKDEFTLKGEVGAAAVKGEAIGTISIFGIKITATATGELGAVGASAEFSSKKGEFSFGSKLSMIAGLGFKIKVNYG